MSVSLGSAFSFAILAGTSITNTGATTVVGDIGLAPGSSYTGGGTVTQTWSQHINDGIASTAQSDLTTAYNSAAAAVPTSSYSVLDGLTLVPGVYNASSTLTLNTALTLNGPGQMLINLCKIMYSKFFSMFFAEK